MKIRRVSRDTTVCQDCLVYLDRRVCLVLKEWLERMDLKEPVATLDLVETQELMESQERSDLRVKW